MTEHIEVRAIHINLDTMRVRVYGETEEKCIDFDLDSLGLTVQQLVYKAQATSW